MDSTKLLLVSNYMLNLYDRRKTDKDTNGIVRRDVLRTAGKTGVASLAIGTGASSAVADSGSEELSEQEVQSLVREALDSEEVTNLLDEHDEIGNVVRGQASGVVIDQNNTSFKSIRIPHQRNNTSSDVSESNQSSLNPSKNYIFWSESPEIDTYASYYNPSADGQVPEFVNVFPDSSNYPEKIGKVDGELVDLSADDGDSGVSAQWTPPSPVPHVAIQKPSASVACQIL